VCKPPIRYTYSEVIWYLLTLHLHFFFVWYILDNIHGEVPCDMMMSHSYYSVVICCLLLMKYSVVDDSMILTMSLWNAVVMTFIVGPVVIEVMMMGGGNDDDDESLLQCNNYNNVIIMYCQLKIQYPVQWRKCQYILSNPIQCVRRGWYWPQCVCDTSIVVVIYCYNGILYC